MQYDWDEAKEARNRRKHGVVFLEAVAALRNVNRVEWIDDRFDHGEERICTVGLALDRLLLVVSFEPGPGLTRVISARMATRHEQERYRQNHP